MSASRELFATVTPVVVAVVRVVGALHALAGRVPRIEFHDAVASARAPGLIAGQLVRVAVAVTPPGLTLIDLVVLVQVLRVITTGALVFRIWDAIAIGIDGRAAHTLSASARSPSAGRAS